MADPRLGRPPAGPQEARRPSESRRQRKIEQKKREGPPGSKVRSRDKRGGDKPAQAPVELDRGKYPAQDWRVEAGPPRPTPPPLDLRESYTPEYLELRPAKGERPYTEEELEDWRRYGAYHDQKRAEMRRREKDRMSYLRGVAARALGTAHGIVESTPQGALAYKGLDAALDVLGAELPGRKK